MINKRITIYDIARELNVSPSTVTRAINGKAGVSDELRARIVETANRLGYRTNRIAKSLTRDTLRIAVVVIDRMASFHPVILDGARRAAEELADFNVEGEYVLLPRENLRGNTIAELTRLADAGVDGIIFTPNPHYGFEEIIAELTRRGVAVGTVISSSDNPDIMVSVSPDGVRAGRLAADLFHTCGISAGDEVLVALGFNNLSVHKNCAAGFREQNERYGFHIVDEIQHYDDPDMAYQLARRYLIEMPGIRGIYCATGVTGPVCRAVCDLGRQDCVRVIGTELSDETAKYMDEGVLVAAIFQDPFRQGRKAFRAMYDYLESGDESRRSLCINPKLVLPGNLDYYWQFLREEEE
ncbi:MAG: LacI family DNA-binding transcriptional regulator [Clostridia bacterium]|nr:LacI family DNA-binding transcriptional regulator [Clostridia bacterium]